MKIRVDSWAAELPEEAQWAIYYKARTCRWNECVEWVQKEFDLDAKPSRTAFYRFLSQMRSEESAHKLDEAKTAALEAAALAKGASLTDEETERAYKQMAVELAMRTGSAKEANFFMKMASALADRRLKAQDLELKARAQETKDSALALAREKFEAAEKRLNAVESVTNSAQLTDAERVAKIKEIFGMK